MIIKIPEQYFAERLEVADRPAFVCSDPRKAPLSPFTGKKYPKRGPNYLKTEALRSDVASALEKAAEANDADGVGAVLGPHLGPREGYLVIVDIDKCRDPEAAVIDAKNWPHAYEALDPEACEVVEKLRGLAEISVSGTGIHIAIVVSGRPTWKGGERFYRGHKIEVYWIDRYIKLTGRLLPSTCGYDLEPRDEELASLLSEYVPKSSRDWADASGGTRQALPSGLPVRIPAGERNEVAFKRLCAARARGYDLASLEELAQELWSRCAQPPGDEMEPDEVLAIARRVASTYPAGSLRREDQHDQHNHAADEQPPELVRIARLAESEQHWNGRRVHVAKLFGMLEVEVKAIKAKHAEKIREAENRKEAERDRDDEIDEAAKPYRMLTQKMLKERVRELRLAIAERLGVDPQSRCQEPHRCLYDIGEDEGGFKGAIRPRCCATLKCAACGIYRRAAMHLAIDLALEIAGSPALFSFAVGGRDFVKSKVRDLDFEKLSEKTRKDGGLVSWFRKSHGERRVLVAGEVESTLRENGVGDLRRPSARKREEALLDFVSTPTGLLDAGTRRYNLPRAWTSTHKLVRLLLRHGPNPDARLVAVGRGVGDARVRQQLAKIGAEVTEDSLDEREPESGGLLFTSPIPIEAVGAEFGYESAEVSCGTMATSTRPDSTGPPEPRRLVA